LLGDSLANILAFCGYSVEREDYIDDLGLQVAELVWGHIHLGSKNAQNKKYDQFLGELYVEVNKALEKDGVKEEIETILKKMEQGNTDEARLSRSISEKCVLAQYETAFNYKVYHNVLIWESDIVAAKLLGAAVDLAKAKGAVITPEEEKYKGTLALDLKQVKDISKEFENPEERYKVLIRSNGVATYAMKDFAFHLWKFGLLKDSFSYSQIIQKQPNGACLYSSSKSGEKRGFGNAKKVINIIDMRQSHEQSTVKALLKLTGSADSASNLTHVAYAIVEIGGKDLSGRSGTWLSSEKNYTADDLLRETTAKAKEKVESSKKISGKKNTDEVAKAIALSAIRFEYLRVGPEKKIDFSWERALNFDANSGPYVMYMYARARSILGKAAYEETQLEARDYGFINNDEFKVIKLISMAQDIAEKSANEYRPNVITDYLLDLSSTFSAFYERNQVIKGGESKNIRLAIVYSAMHAMGNMLRLLGVEPIESM
jgi:arginyl-tRNA synthetase